MGIDSAFDFIKVVYTNAPLLVRFVYTFWILVIALYVYIGKYEKIHDITVPRIPVDINYSYAVWLPGSIAFISYNIGVHMNWSGEITTGRVIEIFQAIGFIFLIGGLILVSWGRLSLNAMWGPNIYEYKEGDRLITNCAYRYCRHPIYTGQMLMALGSFLVTFSWLVAIFPVGTIILNLLRGRKEDKDLAKRFTKAYNDYKNVTNSFLPQKSLN